MGFLPESNAVACRQQAFAHMIKASGYTPVLIGINKNLSWHEYKKEVFNDVECYSIKYASSLSEKLFDSFAIKKTFLKIFEDIGIERIKCFIMQDYQFNTMHMLNKFCRKNKIAFVADLMDWFTPTRDYTLGKNIFKTIDMFFRANFLYPFLNNKIFISSKFYNRFKNDKRNGIIIPCTCTDSSKETASDTPLHDSIKITFAGEPGLRFQKEKLDWVVKALYECNNTIEMNIIGITKDDFILRSGDIGKHLTDYIHFYGRLPRSECLAIIKNSDFSIIVRQSNNLTNYGFSSKICESFACGIPVIATDTSDNKKYIIDGVTGYVCNPDYDSIKLLLHQIDQLDRASIVEMHNNLRENNPLSPENYMECFSAFIENLII